MMNDTTSTVATEAADSKLKEFFVEQLQDILWAEKKLIKVLPKLQEAASSERLRQAFGDHLEETKNHVERLKDVFALVDEKADAKKCPAISGIAEEGEEIIDETEAGTAQRDVGLIFAGQKAEHYEIATYGGLVSLARTLGYSKAAEILDETLNEEKNADLLLTEIAEHNINYMASTEPQNL
jgi:ferritin-like metal-binding protein YciE